MSFHEVRLPARLAFGSTGGVERRTEIVTLGSGFERRSSPWAMGRRRYLIGANLRSLADMAELTAFFEARRGRLEGQAPVSASETVVLGGGNLAAVRAAAGWEILQYREAMLLDGGVWRLSGLLRGQQGTEGEMASGADVGAVVVLLEPHDGRFRMGVQERGLQRRVRVGPQGLTPGGSAFDETVFEMRGLYGRPWSPTTLSVFPGEDGVTVHWMPRVRLGGDVWDLEPAAIDPTRFRIRVLDGGIERRAFEVETTTALYGADDLAEDFPSGPGGDATIRVAQFGATFGWGAEASTRLIV